MMNSSLAFGPVMIDIAGVELTAYDKEKISHPNTGGVILFSRNYESTDQIIHLNNQIRQSRPGPILIAVDQEGGRVQRFLHGFTSIPAASYYGSDVQEAETAGWVMASELLAVNCDFSFAPVLDIDRGVSTVIGNRSFSQDPAMATKLASAYRKGMRRAGMSAVGKHFPGHGAVSADSHLDLPVDERTHEQIQAIDLTPFKYLIQEGIEGIMPAHIIFPDVDQNPAGFSNIWLTTILRKQLQFNGAIFSDDLSMAGAKWAGNCSERGQIALKAGCDMVLICNSPIDAEFILESLPIIENPMRDKRLTNMQGKGVLSLKELQANQYWQQASKHFNKIKNA